MQSWYTWGSQQKFWWICKRFWTQPEEWSVICDHLIDQQQESLGRCKLDHFLDGLPVLHVSWKHKQKEWPHEGLIRLLWVRYRWGFQGCWCKWLWAGRTLWRWSELGAAPSGRRPSLAAPPAGRTLLSTLHGPAGQATCVGRAGASKYLPEADPPHWTAASRPP